MQNIELVFTQGSTTHPSFNGGINEPDWFNNEDDRNTWYTDTGLDSNTRFFYNILKDETNTIFVQYGKNKSGWASGRFYIQELQILNEEFLSNGSIRVEVRSRLRMFKQRETTIPHGFYQVRYKINILGNEVFTYNGRTDDTINQGSSEWFTRTLTVPPSETNSNTAIKFEVVYPNGETGDDVLRVGFGLYNPNPPTYKPMSIRKNNKWETLNKPKGKILIRKNNQWIDRSDENFNTQLEENKGHNRIRKGNKWLQLPPMN